MIKAIQYEFFDEKWMPINGFPNYQVSDWGRVKNCNDDLLKAEVMKLGYLRIQLSNFGVPRKVLIHVLVANAFIPNTNNLPQINHKDGNKTNNEVSNLEWCTKSDNILHSYRVLGRKPCKQTRKRKVVMLDEDSVIIKEFESVHEASRFVGTSPGNICEACGGRYNTIKNHRWAYADS